MSHGNRFMKAAALRRCVGSLKRRSLTRYFLLVRFEMGILNALSRREVELAGKDPIGLIGMDECNTVKATQSRSVSIDSAASLDQGGTGETGFAGREFAATFSVAVGFENGIAAFEVAAGSVAKALKQIRR